MTEIGASISIFLCASLLVPVDSVVVCDTGNGLPQPDPEDCSAFYQCSGDERHQFFCPTGLVFNSDKSFCDWPGNVKCTDSGSPAGSSPVSSSTTTTQTTSTTTAALTTESTSKPTTASSLEAQSTTVKQSIELQSVPSCQVESSEPINSELVELRKSTCTLKNTEVEKIRPKRKENPSNVRNVENILSEERFRELFPKANPAYTYTNFLKAVGKFPSVCSNPEFCPKTLATIFAHFEQETAGLFYIEEIAKSAYCATWSSWVSAAYPCSPGQQYYGRGAKQLSWNYNYGAFSVAMYGDTETLLNNPDLVASTWLNFASAFWFFVTPQPPKPSIQAVVEGTWRPNKADTEAGRVPGFGATTMIINGGLECGARDDPRSANRQRHYRRYCGLFGVELGPEERLGCAGMGQFDARGSASLAIYWAPEQNCKLVTWQTAFTALVEGQREECLKAARARIVTPTNYLWPLYVLFY